MDFNPLIFCKILNSDYLIRNHARDDTAASSFCVPHCNLGKVCRIFSFGKYHFGHSTPHGSPEIKTGKLTYVVKSDPFDLFCCTLEGDITALVARQYILKRLIRYHDSNNTDMERRIIS